MDSSLLLLPLARQRLLQALALGLPPQALTADALAPFLNSPLAGLTATPAPEKTIAAEAAPVHVSSEWTAKEDELLKSLIAEHGTSKWSRVAARMGCKSNRQCRRRWQAVMTAAGNKGSWSAEEDAQLLEGHRRFGNRWTAIARLVPGRTDNAVKNRFAALVAKGECATVAKTKRWSDIPASPPALVKADSLPSSPASSSPPPCYSCSKRAASGVDVSLPAKRSKAAFHMLDLNCSPETEQGHGWLATETQSEGSESESSFSQSHSHESFCFDLNSPASA